MKYKELEDKISKILAAWTRLRPAKSFLGMTLEEFKTALKPSLDARSKIDELQTSLNATIVQRDTADEDAWPLVQRIVGAVIADKDEGNDGELFKEMGYVRRSERASGLTRGHGTPVPPADVPVAKAA